MEETTTIRNKRTGEVKVVNKSDLTKYGIGVAPVAAAPVASAPGKTTSQGIFDILNKIGLSAVPTIAGAGYEAQRAIRTALGTKGLYGNEQTGETIQNPFLTEQRMLQIQNKPLETVGRQTAGLAAFGIPGAKAATLPGVIAKSALTGATRGALGVAGIPETTSQQIAGGAIGGAVVEPLFKIASTYSTFPKLSRLQDQIIEKADAQGNVGQWSNVVNKAKESTLYNSSAGRKAINKILADYSPASITDTIKPSQLMGTRDTITQVYGSKSLFADIFAEPKSKLETKAAETVRRAVSNELEKAAPEIAIPDWFVRQYNKGGFPLKGDIPRKLKTIAIGYGGWKGLRPLFQSIFYTGQMVGK